MNVYTGWTDTTTNKTKKYAHNKTWRLTSTCASQRWIPLNRARNPRYLPTMNEKTQHQENMTQSTSASHEKRQHQTTVSFRGHQSNMSLSLSFDCHLTTPLCFIDFNCAPKCQKRAHRSKHSTCAVYSSNPTKLHHTIRSLSRQDPQHRVQKVSDRSSNPPSSTQSSSTAAPHPAI